MDKICRILHGSHLYGVSTPESDRDYKEVYLPSINSLLLERAKHNIQDNTNNSDTKNTKSDVDCESFSLQEFLRLLQNGNPMAIEMIYAPKECIVESSSTWDALMGVRHLFLTNKIHAFSGYCKAQAAKYCLKGDRLNVLKLCVGVLEQACAAGRRGWFDDLVIACKGYNEVDPCKRAPSGNRMVEILDKQFEENTAPNLVLDSLQKKMSHYGHRAKRAANLDGNDWKALSHAIRVCFEAIEILQTGHLTLPLQTQSIVLGIKQGQYSFKVVQIMIEELNVIIQEEKIKTKLPNDVSSKVVEDFILEQYGRIKND